MTSALRKQLSRLSIWHRLLQDAPNIADVLKLSHMYWSRKLVRWAESQQLQIVSFRGARFYEAATLSNPWPNAGYIRTRSHGPPTR